VPRSAVRTAHIQVKVDALGLPPRIVDVPADGQTFVVDVALDLNFTEQLTVGVGMNGRTLYARVGRTF
jgi:hypothetical protein